MAKNITLMGADYPQVPAVQLPQTGGGTAIFYDIEIDTVTVTGTPDSNGYLDTNILCENYTILDIDSLIVNGSRLRPFKVEILHDGTATGTKYAFQFKKWDDTKVSSGTLTAVVRRLKK